MSRPCLSRRRPDPAAVPVNDPLNNREAHSSAGIIFSSMKTLKNAKQFARISHVKAGAVVSDVIGTFVALMIAIFIADLYRRRTAIPGVFECVGKQIDEYLFEQRRIRLAGRKLIY